MPASWNPVTLGRTGLAVLPLGLGSSYGPDEKSIARAFERGLNFVLWGLRRRGAYAAAIRHASPATREKLVIAVQSYSRLGTLVRPSVELALRRLKLERVAILCLGWWNGPPPPRVVEAALRLRDEGKVGHLMVSCHHRPTFAELAADPAFGAYMVRYNAAHPGAEREVFPFLPTPRQGIVSFTATRWGTLLDPRFAGDDPVPRASDCYRFALTNPSVDVVLTGPKDRAELDEAFAALDRGPMTAGELAWIGRVGARARAGGKGSPLDFLDGMGRAGAGISARE